MNNLIDLSQENDEIDAELDEIFDLTQESDHDDETEATEVIQPTNTPVPVGANGNTKKSTDHARYLYVMTISCAKCANANELWDLLDDNCKRFVFQKEEGEGGYRHYQIALSLKEKMRMAQVKEAFAGLGAHIEKMKHVTKAWKYAQKKETRVEGPWDKNRRPIEIITELHAWQLTLRDILEEKPDNRTVHWYYDLIGGTGKTSFCKYIVSTTNARYFNNNRTADVAHAWNGESIVLFDFMRDDPQYINYRVIEQLKNGILFSGKYESKQKVFNSPHVVCFANYLPNMAKLSADRWHIVEIQQIHTNLIF